MRFAKARHGGVERLLWTRDSRLVARLTRRLPKARVIELADSGWSVIADAADLGEEFVARLAKDLAYGMADVDQAESPQERYMIALGHAVSVFGPGERIGRGEAAEIGSQKLLSRFFAARAHRVEFQPIVDLESFRASEWECLFRPGPDMGHCTVTEIVGAALTVNRPLDLDNYMVAVTLPAIASVARRPRSGPGRSRFGVNLLPASLLSPMFEAEAFGDRVRAAGLAPNQIIVECTEQQAIHDVPRLKKQVKALRRLGFGFAVDDAGAGYASFNVIASLEPSIIKIDREIVSGIGDRNAEAKRALVEAFVSFSRRIGAKVIAEGIEHRRDLLALQDQGVDFGQGYLLGKSAPEPEQPRRLREVEDLTLVFSGGSGWDGAIRTRAASMR